MKSHLNDNNKINIIIILLKNLKKDIDIIDERIIQKEYKYDKSICKKYNSKLTIKDYYLYCKLHLRTYEKPQTCFINNCQNEKHNKISFCKEYFVKNLNEKYNSEDEYEDIDIDIKNIKFKTNII